MYIVRRPQANKIDGEITVFPTEIRSRLKSGAQTRISLETTFTSTIARVDKSARVTAVVEAIRKEKFTDYTKPAKHLARRGWTVEEWGLYMWSDECSVERGRGKAQEWCFRTPAQKWQKEMIQTYTCGKDMKVMVYAAFWDTGRTQLYIMDRDFESKKHGYSANSYVEVLIDPVLYWYRKLDRGYIFMQDNASIYTAGKIKDRFRDNRITTTDWPPYSPDLNPIENAWWELKKKSHEMFPEVMACKCNSEENRQRLESCLQATWDIIPKEFFDVLIESMPRRIEACIKAEGGTPNIEALAWWILDLVRAD
jgi:hypothetical protein